MSSARVSVEWLFGNIVNCFKLLDFRENLKMKLSVVYNMYILRALLRNARSCFYETLTENYFELQPPLIG